MAGITYGQLFAKSIPSIVMWGSAFSALVLWPHPIIWAHSKIRHAPNINDHSFIKHRLNAA